MRTTSKTEWNWLDVSALLAYRMMQRGQTQVAAATGISVPALLDMIEGARGFNRRVLRYLGLKRINRYRFLDVRGDC